MKLPATYAFNCVVLMVKFGWTSCEDIPPALYHLCHFLCIGGEIYSDMDKI